MTKRNRHNVIDSRWEKKAEVGRVVNPKIVERESPKPVQAKNQFQKDVLNAIATKPVVVVLAPAGSGKSYVVMSEISDRLKKNKVDKVILARPAVGMGKNTIGLLKGDLQSKYEPYLMPLIEVIRERYGRGFYDTQVANGNIELLPLEYARGRNFSGVAIVDEFQNVTKDEAFSLITRISGDGQLIMMGDPTQTDLRGENALVWLERFVEEHDLQEYIAVVRGTSYDIVRSDICRAFVQSMEYELAYGG